MCASPDNQLIMTYSGLAIQDIRSSRQGCSCMSIANQRSAFRLRRSRTPSGETLKFVVRISWSARVNYCTVKFFRFSSLTWIRQSHQDVINLILPHPYFIHHQTSRTQLVPKAKHLSLLSSLLPHQCGISTILPAPKHKKISSMLKLKPASKAAARI